MPRKAAGKANEDNEPTATAQKPSAAPAKRARKARKPKAMPSREGARMVLIRQAVDDAIASAPEVADSPVTARDLQDQLTETEAQAAIEDASISTQTDTEDGDGHSEALLVLRQEIDHLKARLAIIREQAATVVKANAEWADASARDQLGAYPWGKLVGTMAAVFLAMRVLKRSRLL